jgi:hypothetical protein
MFHQMLRHRLNAAEHAIFVVACLKAVSIVRQIFSHSCEPILHALHALAHMFSLLGVSSPETSVLSSCSSPETCFHHVRHHLVALAHLGLPRRAAHKSMSNGLFVFRLTENKRCCDKHRHRCRLGKRAITPGGIAPPLRVYNFYIKTNLRGPALQFPPGGMLMRSSSSGT